MAKLNDPPAPAAESIDALKRRFIRQNREFARVNSNQSQRIRNLEAEISRLLAENIAIREQAINSAADAERWRTSDGLGKDVSALRDRLVVKLAEVHGMVEELGGLPQKAAIRSNTRRRKSTGVPNTVRSPNERDWRNRQTIGGVLNAEGELQDGRLPAILEDKYYPRRTLEPAEFGHLADEVNGKKEDTESPDLGPPPVAHFDVTEPILFDSSKAPKRVSGGIISDDDEVLTLPNNLEARRKRRTSSLLQDMSVLEEETPELNGSNDSVSLLKAGAKRKLDISHFEEEKPSTAPVDDFVFHRKGDTLANRPKSSRFARPQGRQHDNQLSSEALSPHKAMEPTRKVLASKSTNSPSKRRVAASFYKKDMETTNRDNRTSRPIQASGKEEVRPPQRIDISKDTGTELQTPFQPKTPGITSAELFSPLSVSTEPSAKPTAIAKSEVAITNSVEDVLNGSIGRGSRRARAAVSYAEPNLRDKMRRSDKKLVGAVEGLKKESSRDSNLDAPDHENPQSVVGTEDSASVKTEAPVAKPDTEGWRHLPTTQRTTTNREETVSPLRDKESSSVVARATERRHKRTFSEVDGTRIKIEPSEAGNEIDKAVERLSIYDPPTSSPFTESHRDKENDGPPKDPLSSRVPASTNPPDSQIGNGNSATARSRRHSVQIQSSSIPGLVPGAHKTVDKVPTRPSSAMSVREADLATKEAASQRLKRASSSQALTHNSSQLRHQAGTFSQPALAEGETITVARTIGARRRSMMV